MISYLFLSMRLNSFERAEMRVKRRELFWQAIITIDTLLNLNRSFKSFFHRPLLFFFSYKFPYSLLLLLLSLLSLFIHYIFFFFCIFFFSPFYFSYFSYFWFSPSSNYKSADWFTARHTNIINMSARSDALTRTIFSSIRFSWIYESKC